LQANKRDVHNKRALRTLVHKRAKVLNYFRRKNEVGYVELLEKLGLEREAVEGEVIVR
jgi:small subunit ribosomal protein S15